MEGKTYGVDCSHEVGGSEEAIQTASHTACPRLKPNCISSQAGDIRTESSAQTPAERQETE